MDKWIPRAVEGIRDPRQEGVRPHKGNFGGKITSKFQVSEDPTLESHARNSCWPKQGETILERDSRELSIFSPSLSPPCSSSSLLGSEKTALCWGEGNKRGRRNQFPPPQKATCRPFHGGAKTPLPGGGTVDSHVDWTFWILNQDQGPYSFVFSKNSQVMGLPKFSPRDRKGTLPAGQA